MIKAETKHKSLKKVERHTEEVNQITLGLSLPLDKRWGTCQSRNDRNRDFAGPQRFLLNRFPPTAVALIHAAKR